MLGEERILPEFLFPLLSGEEMRTALERKISHEIVSSGRSGNCAYEYVDATPAKGKGKTVLPVIIAVFFTIAFLSATAPAMAATTNITTYWYVQVQTSLSVSFPTGLTNITFFDTTPLVVSNVTATGQHSTTGAVEMTDSGDTNITLLTAQFISAWPNNFAPSGGQSILFVGIMTAYNDSGSSSWGPASTVLAIYWLPHNDTLTQNLIGSELGPPGHLSAYGSAEGSWTQHIYVWAWATFNASVYATQGTDQLSIDYQV